MTMNNFGCTIAMVRSRLTTGNYSPTEAELGGTTVINDCLASAVDQIIQSMPEIVFRQLTQVELEIVERRATEGQTLVRTTLTPVVDGKTYIWRGQPKYFLQKPKKKTDLLADEEFFDPSVHRPLSELDPSEYTINLVNGEITLNDPLKSQDQVAVTYEVDSASTDYKVGSLSICAADGAAYLLASRLYPRASSKWEYLDMLNEQFTKKLESLQDQSWVPPELRLINFWKIIEPVGDKKAGVKWGRFVRG